MRRFELCTQPRPSFPSPLIHHFLPTECLQIVIQLGLPRPGPVALSTISVVRPENLLRLVTDSSYEAEEVLAAMATQMVQVEREGMAWVPTWALISQSDASRCIIMCISTGILGQIHTSCLTYRHSGFQAEYSNYQNGVSRDQLQGFHSAPLIHQNIHQHGDRGVSHASTGDLPRSD